MYKKQDQSVKYWQLYHFLSPCSNILDKFLVFDWLAMEDKQHSNAVPESIHLVLNIRFVAKDC